MLMTSPGDLRDSATVLRYEPGNLPSDQVLCKHYALNHVQLF